MVVDDVIVFSREPGDNLRWWGHEVTHVRQYEQLGVERFARAYIFRHGSIEREAEEMGQRVAQAQVALGAALATSSRVAGQSQSGALKRVQLKVAKKHLTQPVQRSSDDARQVQFHELSRRLEGYPLSLFPELAYDRKLLVQYLYDPPVDGKLGWAPDSAWNAYDLGFNKMVDAFAAKVAATLASL